MIKPEDFKVGFVIIVIGSALLGGYFQVERWFKSLSQEEQLELIEYTKNATKLIDKCETLKTIDGKIYKGIFNESYYGSVYYGNLVDGSKIEFPSTSVLVITKGCENAK